MEQHFSNIFKEFKCISRDIKENFKQSSDKEKWMYAMRAYSVYIVLLTYVLNTLHGMLAAQALLFYAGAAFIAVSFIISKDLGSDLYRDKREQTIFRHIIFFYSIVFLPTVFVFASIASLAIAFFTIVLAFTLVQYFGFHDRDKLSKLKMIFYGITKTKKERKTGGLHYAVREVGDTTEGIQE